MNIGPIAPMSKEMTSGGVSLGYPQRWCAMSLGDRRFNVLTVVIALAVIVVTVLLESFLG